MSLYVVTYLVALSGLLMGVNRSEKRRRRYVMTIFLMMIVISAMRKYTVGIDLNKQYYALFQRCADLNWSQVGSTAYDIGYVIFNKIILLFTTNPQWMIAIHSIFVIGVSGYFILKNSEDVVMSTLIFIANHTWFMYMNVMRQALAISMILIACEIWKKKNLIVKRYVFSGLFFFLAVSMHSSALLMLIVPFMEKWKFKKNTIIVAICSVFGVSILYSQLFRMASALLGMRRNYSAFYEGSVSGAGSITITSIYGIGFYLCVLIIAYYVLVKKKQLDFNAVYQSKNNRYSNSFLMFAVLFLILIRVMALRSNIIGRFGYYFLPFGWLLTPVAINCCRLSTNRKIIKSGMYSVLSIVFFVITYFNAASLYGVVPYNFFWR